eukprot:CAMPEP_0180783280 /NCGR_PEP_ID=MMETSP1038_2-20121128/48889_2 /TAXON_ID=632150 /ORGANISM="Azadinium spinosum, Strain 3D9" /LENGTH=58 /DNA_ID=CAMNT_0022819737 /DNA_START=344 /DNA_END=520 /DNA_ORIENTATION=-
MTLDADGPQAWRTEAAIFSTCSARMFRPACDSAAKHLSSKRPPMRCVAHTTTWRPLSL